MRACVCVCVGVDGMRKVFVCHSQKDHNGMEFLLFNDAEAAKMSEQ